MQSWSSALARRCRELRSPSDCRTPRERDGVSMSWRSPTERAPMRVALRAAASQRRAIERADVRSCRARLPRSGALLVRGAVLTAPAARRGRPRRASGRACAGKRPDRRPEPAGATSSAIAVLSPALDGVLARRVARKAAVAVVLSERARSCVDGRTHRHASSSPTTEPTRRRRGGAARPAGSTRCSPGTSVPARGSTPCSKPGASSQHAAASRS